MWWVVVVGCGSGFGLAETSTNSSSSSSSSSSAHMLAWVYAGGVCPRQTCGSSTGWRVTWRHRCGACLWRSCASGVQCMGQLAVEVRRCGSRGPRPARQRPCEGTWKAGLGAGERGAFVVRCCWSWLALAVQLLLRCCRASPGLPTRARVRGCKEEAAREPEARALGRGGAARPLSTRSARHLRRGVLAGGGATRRRCPGS